MNKRIKELAIQSGAWDRYEINEGVDGDEKPLEKFAELIVYDFLSELTNDDAEIDQLRADAERYRWMKREVKRIPPGWALVGWDAAIDAAMKQAALQGETAVWAARNDPRE